MSNGIVNVTITPVSGIGITQLGMFNISVMPVKPTDQILALQYIVSAGGQPPGEFLAFAFIGDLPVGAGLPSSIFYASCDGVFASQFGLGLTVQVAGGINSAENPFDVSQTFTQNLWPNGNCLATLRKQLNKESKTY